MAKQIVAVTEADLGQVGHLHVITARFDRSMSGESVETVMRRRSRGHLYYVVVDERRSEIDIWTCDRCGRTTVRAYADGRWNDALARLVATR